MEKRLSNFEHLIEESQWAQRHRVIWEKIGLDKGEKIGLDKGILQGAQRMVVQVIQNRFPGLVALARPSVERIKRTEELDALMVQLLVASDESTIIDLLHIPSA